MPRFRAGAARGARTSYEPPADDLPARLRLVAAIVEGELAHGPRARAGRAARVSRPQRRRLREPDDHAHARPCRSARSTHARWTRRAGGIESRCLGGAVCGRTVPGSIRAAGIPINRSYSWLQHWTWRRDWRGTSGRRHGGVASDRTARRIPLRREPHTRARLRVLRRRRALRRIRRGRHHPDAGLSRRSRPDRRSGDGGAMGRRASTRDVR